MTLQTRPLSELPQVMNGKLPDDGAINLANFVVTSRFADTYYDHGLQQVMLNDPAIPTIFCMSQERAKVIVDRIASTLSPYGLAELVYADGSPHTLSLFGCNLLAEYRQTCCLNRIALASSGACVFSTTGTSPATEPNNDRMSFSDWLNRLVDELLAYLELSSPTATTSSSSSITVISGAGAGAGAGTSELAIAELTETAITDADDLSMIHRELLAAASRAGEQQGKAIAAVYASNLTDTISRDLNQVKDALKKGIGGGLG